MAQLRRSLLRFLLALGALTCLGAPRADAAEPQINSHRRVAVGDLVGLAPIAVRAKLADLPADWPDRRSFEAATPDGPVRLISLSDLLLDPVLVEEMARWASHSDAYASQAHTECRSTLIRGGHDATPLADILLVFNDGRLAGAFGPSEASLKPATRRYSPKAPVSSALVARPGDLPLDDGLAFLSRWDRPVLSASDVIEVDCAPWSPPRLPRPAARKQGRLSASDMQGLALLPCAITLPAKNRARVAARARGAELLAGLHVGQRLAERPERFARDHQGVRALHGYDPEYVVLTIDMGGYPSRNLSNFDDVALIGVRAGRIEWIAPSQRYGTFAPGTRLLCLDRNGVPGRVRPGCTDYGDYQP